MLPQSNPSNCGFPIWFPLPGRKGYRLQQGLGSISQPPDKTKLAIEILEQGCLTFHQLSQLPSSFSGLEPGGGLEVGDGFPSLQRLQPLDL